MSYAAIIFDLDGTAMPSAIDAMPSQVLIDTVKKHVSRIHLSAATGRAWTHAKPVIQALGLKAPCIIGGGAMIVDPVEERILWQETIPAAALDGVLATARRFPYKVAHAVGLDVSPKVAPAEASVSGSVNTFYILDVPGDKDQAIIDELEKIEGIIVSKALSWFMKGGVDLHVTNHRATKEHAVAELCSRLKIDSRDVAGVGDGFNDLHLFKAVGHKVAMGNAVDALKAAADSVIGNLDENGLADFIAAAASN